VRNGNCECFIVQADYRISVFRLRIGWKHFEETAEANTASVSTTSGASVSVGKKVTHWTLIVDYHS